MKRRRIKHRKIICSSIKLLLIAYIIFFLVSSLLVFYIHKPEIESWQSRIDGQKFYGDQPIQDRVVLVEERSFAGAARLDLFAKAETSIDITLHVIQSDPTADLFFAGLVAAADRGVQVRIVLDGLFSNMIGNRRSIEYALVAHPNIEMKYYEKVNLLTPWSLHNRMHDKFIIIDDRYALIGGRNIGERYFYPDLTNEAVEDRDVVIVNTRPDLVETSVIYEFKKYFLQLWYSDYSVAPADKLSTRQKKSGADRNKSMGQILEEFSQNYDYNYDWVELSVPANRIRLIHNPLTRLNKEPWVLAEIAGLIQNSQSNIIIQSPYIVPTRRMLEVFDSGQLKDKTITILTNSIAASPNPFAMSGYIHHRNRLIEQTNLYEYHGSGSIHAKTVLIDDRLSLIGSFNLDSRSSFLSTETMVVIDSEEFAAELKAEMQELIDFSVFVSADSEQQGENLLQLRQIRWMKKIAISILSFFALFMDIFL